MNFLSKKSSLTIIVDFVVAIFVVVFLSVVFFLVVVFYYPLIAVLWEHLWFPYVLNYNLEVQNIPHYLNKFCLLFLYATFKFLLKVWICALQLNFFLLWVEFTISKYSCHVLRAVVSEQVSLFTDMGNLWTHRASWNTQMLITTETGVDFWNDF